MSHPKRCTIWSPRVAKRKSYRQLASPADEYDIGLPGQHAGDCERSCVSIAATTQTIATYDKANWFVDATADRLGRVSLRLYERVSTLLGC